MCCQYKGVTQRCWYKMQMLTTKNSFVLFYIPANNGQFLKLGFLYQ